ncbi:hypothetical protein P691DRAFT_805744 [Macrolepiota fuliginosa MF-IS2]|uniref:Uncharacterized protein n=1 Tax=Macrolepiota fuliginosa MF-IS2 TaxID=1400762 RepID=A0A9P6C1A6_9AGAR|nr:hypothetical protein P691DRAFT_805744 [Macrolepiota fuliginosa MF-IS2]
MSLFTNTPFRASNFRTTIQTTPSKPPSNHPTSRIPGLGYILFPSPNAQWNHDIDPDINTPEEATAPRPDESETAESAPEDGPDSHVQRRRELEAEEARKGEEDWVRSGGVLRDAQGQRDWARTQSVREELRLREIEKEILQRWERYERRWGDIWSMLKKGDGFDTAPKLQFEDIPWPVKEAEIVGKGRQRRPIRIEELTVDRVKEFLLEGLTVRDVRITKRDRVRSSLLRWHPDKLGNLLARIHPGDIENIMKGIGVVMECLQKLNAEV